MTYRWSITGAQIDSCQLSVPVSVGFLIQCGYGYDCHTRAPQPPPPSAKQEPENREEYWFLLNAPKHLKTHTEGLLITVVATRTEKLPNIAPTQKGILPWRPSLSACRVFQAPENEATIGQFRLLSITRSWNQSKCTFYIKLHQATNTVS